MSLETKRLPLLLFQQQANPRFHRIMVGVRYSLSLIVTGTLMSLVMGITFLAIGDDGFLEMGIAFFVVGILIVALGVFLGYLTRKNYRIFKEEMAANGITATTVIPGSMAVPPGGVYPHHPGVQPGGVYPPGVYPQGHPQQPPVAYPSHSEGTYPPGTVGYPPQPELHAYQTGPYPPPQTEGYPSQSECPSAPEPHPPSQAEGSALLPGVYPPQTEAYPPKDEGYEPQTGADLPETNTKSSHSEIAENSYQDDPPPYPETEIPLKEN